MNKTPIKHKAKNKNERTILYEYKIKDYVKSHLGKATVLDQSINRPDHVVKHFGDALNAFFQSNPNVPKKPAEWGRQHANYESQIIEYYGKHRPGMTDPFKRFNKTKKEGMSHFCPKCKVLSKAVASENGFIQVNGKNPIVAGDTSTCGSKYIKISDLAVRDRGTKSSSAMKIIPLINDLFFSDEYVLIDSETSSIISDMPYKIHRENGKVEEGITDKNGLISSLQNSSAEKIKIEIINNMFDLEGFLDEYF